MRELGEAAIAQLPQDKVNAAVEWLRDELAKPGTGGDEGPSAAYVIRRYMAADGADWPHKLHGGGNGFPGVGFHFSGGMAVRNAMRRAGYGEMYFDLPSYAGRPGFESGTLDDIYIGLIERAVRE